jgi:glycosyltransferase involved in cell wall biosynthesis
MRILQVTNFISHLQTPLAQKLVSIIGAKNFRLATLHTLDSDRINLGWSDKHDESWIIRVKGNKSKQSEFKNWWNEADVIICGEREFEGMLDRTKNKKLCFYFSERWWKPPIGVARLFSPYFFKMVIKFRRLTQNSNFHYLPIGPYASSDIDLLFNLNERKWRWGYFNKNFSPLPKLSYKRSEIIKVLWVGRMLKWKRVDTLIYAIADLSKKGLNVKLSLIGDGPEKINLQKLAAQLLSLNQCSFIDPMDPCKIPTEMQKNNIYVLSSSACEGWGFVINEAMSSGCAIVASKSAGAAAAMIVNDVNGLLFESGNWRELSSQLMLLINNKELRYKLIKNALITINGKWSSECAAKRFVLVADALLNHKKIPFYEDGPMSRP